MKLGTLLLKLVHLRMKLIDLTVRFSQFEKCLSSVDCSWKNLKRKRLLI
jgi:hypothetical protein